MKRSCAEFEDVFKQYRESLRREIHCFRDSASVFWQLTEHTQDHLPEINLAPSFFRVAEDALFTTIVLWADKLFDERGERGLFNFLNFVEHNREWLSKAELKRRNAYPDDHWMLRDRIAITAKSIQSDREKIRSLVALRNIRIRRDKFHGHFDKEYFFDRSRLGTEAPLTWDELDEAGEVMGAMLNAYSVEFDGNIFSWDTPNDLGCLLDAARTEKSHAD